MARADKNKAIVIINKDALEQKIMAFIQENHITCLDNADPTGITKMLYINREKQTQISDEHKT
jgi:hypothetical protein